VSCQERIPAKEGALSHSTATGHLIRISTAATGTNGIIGTCVGNCWNGCRIRRNFHLLHLSMKFCRYQRLCYLRY